MFIHYRTKGIVLKKEDRGESDQLFTVYAKDFGRILVLGRAIRKISSKLRAGIDIFYLSEIEFIQGKAYKTLTDALVVEKFSNIRRNLGKLKIAHKVAEITVNFLKGEEKDDKLWALLLDTLNAIDDKELKAKKARLLLYYYIWHFFSLLGYEFQLYHCAICEKKLIAEQLFFNIESGGIVCPKCASESIGSKPIDLNSIKILRIISKKDWKTLNRVKIESIDFKSLKNLFENYLSYLPGEIKAG
jgi:DNA repair protein RecO (recombination protein O)